MMRRNLVLRLLRIDNKNIKIVKFQILKNNSKLNTTKIIKKVYLIQSLQK